MEKTDIYDEKERNDLSCCQMCPGECRVNRNEDERGFCGAGSGLNVASICLHKGEEPVICGKDGICNVFFAGCNMRCLFCQNHEISSPGSFFPDQKQDLQSVLDQITGILSGGIRAVGFVSPSHVVPQVKAIIRGIHDRGFHPVIIYNTNSYDKVETLKSLDGLIDVYLPDFKYITPSLALRYSSTPDYPELALKAIKEIYYQKGSRLITDASGMAESGMLIRHLVLPGQTEESKKVLRTIAEELSPGVHLSLMSQYHPEGNLTEYPELNRTLYREEYESLIEFMNSLGFRNGYTQEMDSNQNYRPDFSKEHPFE